MQILLKSYEIYSYFTIFIEDRVPSFLQRWLEGLKYSGRESHHLSALCRNYFDVLGIR